MSYSVELAQKVFDVEAQAILALKDRVGDSFQKAVDLLVKCEGKVVVSGIGKSGIIGRKIASTLSSTGTPAIYLHPAESSHGDLGIITEKDVVIAISYGGETPELNSLLSFVSRKGIAMIAMTGNLQSELAKKARAVLDVKVSREACPLGLAPTASSTATLAMGDALAMVALQAKGFGVDDFAQFHPGGGLGFKLSRIRDIMHTGLTMPLLTSDVPMKQVISAMSRGEVRGAVGIVDVQGDLIGIITDGDIRRLIENSDDPLSGTAGERMGKNPKTIDANEIAEKALFMMEQFRINLLYVLDQQSAHPKKPVGVIHIQDLIRAKVK